MKREKVDLMIETKWVVTASLEQPLLQNTTVVINQQKILAILPIEAAKAQFSSTDLVILDSHVLMPGLINLHTHAAMSLMRGLADDKPLMTWLNDYIWPAEQAVVTVQYVKDASLLSAAEMLAGGTTCFNDMYFYPEATYEASNQAGIRANLGLVVIDFKTNYANDAEDCLKKGVDVHAQLAGQSLVTTSLAPHAPYTVSDTSFERILSYADQMDLTIHTHLHETLNEITESEKVYGVRPIERLQNIGLLGSNLTAAHVVHCNTEEMALLAEYGCHVAHCPSSNLKLGSGVAPVSQLLASDVNIGLGTDGVASNNRLDMFAEMRLAALLAKGVNQDATALPAQKAVEMVTINAAKAVGLDKKIGSIEIGKEADLTAIDLSDLSVSPCYDPISHLVYACGREHVTHTWVAGNLRYNRGKFTNIDAMEITAIIDRWQPKLNALKEKL